MAKRLRLEDKLERLAELGGAPLDAAAVAELRAALADRSNAVAARAAELARERRCAELIPELVECFARCMRNLVKGDPGCLAKIAVVEALSELQYGEFDVYLRGIRHVQLEPVYGGRADTAANLRAKCAFALAGTRYREVMFELGALLMDGEPQPRRAAAQIIAELGREDGELLLRMKVRAGDPLPDVLGEYLAALMSINAVRSLPLVAGFLTGCDPAVAEQAALALGESREAEAFDALRAAWKASVEPGFKKVLLLSVALLRRDEAFAFLLDVLRDERPALALAALEALELYAADEARRGEIRRVVERRGDLSVPVSTKRAFDLA